MAKNQKRKAWPDSSRRVRRWQQKRGKRVTTFLDENTMERLKNEVKFTRYLTPWRPSERATR
jgi:ribosomal protein S25